MSMGSLRTAPWILAALVALCAGVGPVAAADLHGLVREFEARMGDKSDPGYDAQQEILTAIADLRSPQARERLREMLKQYGRADRRRAALILAALVRHGTPKDVDDAIEWVERTSRDPLLMELLHRALGGVQSPAAREWLRGDALQKATPRVKVQIVRALAMSGDSRNVLPLIRLLREPSRLVRIEALEALGNLEATNALGFIKEILRDEDPQLRDAAARALGRLGDTRCVKPLVAALTDEAPRVVESAARALGRIAESEAVPALIEGLTRARGTDLRLADAFQRALEEISGKDIGDDPELWHGWWEAVKDKPLVKEKLEPGRKTVPGLRYHDLPVRSSRLIFVLDVSRSMGWNHRLETAQEEIIKVIQRLPDTTRFNVIMYSDEVWSWRPKLTAARSGAAKDAISFIRRQRPVNGTNTYAALAAAMRDPEVDTVFLLSDGHPSVGDVTDPDLILLQVREWNRYRRVRIHGVALLRGEPPSAFMGIEDPDRSRSFMQHLARANDGLFKEVR
jgi:HEAT repeat protein